MTQKYALDTQETLGGIQVSQATVFNFQTTVPFSSRFANVFTLPFDTMNFTPAIALVNPSFQAPANVMITYLTITKHDLPGAANAPTRRATNLCALPAVRQR